MDQIPKEQALLFSQIHIYTHNPLLSITNIILKNLI
jgi:hypothetical protein